MSHRFTRIAVVLNAVMCIVAPASPLVAQDADIVGAWDVTVTTGQGPDTSAPLLLQKDGDQIVGTLSSPQGAQSVEASVKDMAVTMWFSVRTQNGPIDVTMKGVADGDTMKGSMDFGGRGQGQWPARRSSKAAATAVQAADSRVDVSGTWTSRWKSAATTGTPTMTFKQDGEKLSGRYSGQLGEAPLTGTCERQRHRVLVRRQHRRQRHPRRLFGHRRKGLDEGQRSSFGDLGDGTFTANENSKGGWHFSRKGGWHLSGKGGQHLLVAEFG